MSYSLHFIFRNFPGSDIESTINLSRVSRYDLGIEIFCYIDTECCLSAGSWSIDDDNFWKWCCLGEKYGYLFSHSMPSFRVHRFRGLYYFHFFLHFTDVLIEIFDKPYNDREKWYSHQKSYKAEEVLRNYQYNKGDKDGKIHIGRDDFWI